jgi:V8-like Glu-specific endopeptidase
MVVKIPDDGRTIDLYAYDCTTFAGNSGAPVIDETSNETLAHYVLRARHHEPLEHAVK